jgi:hypothetical protein
MINQKWFFFNQFCTQNPTVRNCAPHRKRFVILTENVLYSATWD